MISLITMSVSAAMTWAMLTAQITRVALSVLPGRNLNPAIMLSFGSVSSSLRLRQNFARPTRGHFLPRISPGIFALLRGLGLAHNRARSSVFPELVQRWVKESKHICHEQNCDISANRLVTYYTLWAFGRVPDGL